MRLALDVRALAWHLMRVIATVCMARFSTRSPPRLSRCLIRRPLVTSSGVTPTSEANAASLLTRPGWGQLMISWPATTVPTPGSAALLRPWRSAGSVAPLVGSLASLGELGGLRKTPRAGFGALGLGDPLEDPATC